MIRRKGRLRKINPYGYGKCRICGKVAIPPLGAGFCKKHMPDKVKCIECGTIFDWHYKGSALCSKCWDSFIQKIKKEHSNAFIHSGA